MKNNSWPRVKMIVCTMMLLVCVLLWVCRMRPWGFWALAAIVLSWMGDGLLAGCMLPRQLVEKGFYIGGVSFALAHGCYAAAIVTALRVCDLPLHGGRLALQGGALALAVLLHGLRFLPRCVRDRSFMVLANLYLAAVAFMTALSLYMTLEIGPELWPLGVGALLFLTSDMILMAREYNPKLVPRMRGAIMPTYVAGQLLLQLGLWLIRP